MPRRMFIHINAVLLGGLLPAYATGQTLPRGYETIQVTQNPAHERRARVNRHGQIVFQHWADVSNAESLEIFMYDARTSELTQITDNDVLDFAPDINDAGVICWSSGIGPDDPHFGTPTLEIMVRDPDGTVTRLTDNAVTDMVPAINALGQMAWYRYGPWGCGGPVMDIYMFDGQRTIQITNDGVPDTVENQLPEINELSEICWTRLDFCDPPPGFNFASKIMLYSAGRTFELTDGRSVPQNAVINNRSQVLWNDRDENANRVIEMWDAGVTTRITDDGANPSVNDAGQVAFNRWDPDRGVWDVWLYRDDVFYQLTFDSFWNAGPSINSDAEVAWSSGPFPTGDIRFLRRFATGDLNCDGAIDAFDIEPFIFALFDPGAYLDRYPDCDPLLADANGDGVVDAFDIEAFLEILFP